MTQSLYIDVDGTPSFCVLHRPDGPPRDTAVIFCPPFGWEEVCSYRILRAWAARLADAGFPTLRLTLPSCGDSGGVPRDPGRIEAWTSAVSAAARAVRAQTGAGSVVAVGLGLGGILAYRAAAAGAPIDGLVLWATPARGRELTRQLKAFARLEASQVFEGLPAPPPLPEGEMEVGGFLLSGESQAELGAVELSTLTLPRSLARGALLLERDGIAVDERLREALAAQGVTVEAGPGDGYAEMTSHPQQSQVPEAVLARVLAWLERGPAATASAQDAGGAPSTSDSATFDVDGVEVVETPVDIPQDFGNLSGILTTPGEGGAPVCLLLLNAGAMRRIGPSRMWVEAARRWAARGIPSLRLDVEAIGEADGAVSPYGDDNELYGPELVPQVTAALDFLAARGVGRRFILAGLCAGAYWSLYAGLEDPRVTAALLFNSRAIVWDTGLAPSRDLRRMFSEPLTWTRLRHNVTWRRFKAVVQWLARTAARWLTQRGAGGGSPALRDQVGPILGQVQSSGLRTLFLFAAAEPLEEELVRTGWLAQLEQWPNVTITRVPVRDHTLRPCLAQQQGHAALDRAVEAELAMAAPTAPAS
jgi:pimeloyl-ACP methyl ester carboxylesterase